MPFVTLESYWYYQLSSNVTSNFWYPEDAPRLVARRCLARALPTAQLAYPFIVNYSVNNKWIIKIYKNDHWLTVNGIWDTYQKMGASTTRAPKWPGIFKLGQKVNPLNIDVLGQPLSRNHVLEVSKAETPSHSKLNFLSGLSIGLSVSSMWFM